MVDQTHKLAAVCRLVIERDRTATGAVEAQEWKLRHAEIQKQAEEARREKKRRRAESELAVRSQVLNHVSCTNLFLWRYQTEVLAVQP